MPRVTGRKGKAGGAPAAIDANMMLTNEESRRKLQVLESTLLARKQWSDLLGQTHGGDRDLYESCGWKKNPNHQDYKRRFERQDVAHTLVTAYPDATWREAPTIRENDTKKDTPFEKAFKEHAEKVNLWHYLRRVDTMAGIGEYAVLLLGFKDPAELSKEITKAQEVMYLQPFFQGDAEISEWNNDPKNARYGLPQQYKLTTRIGQVQSESKEMKVGEPLQVHSSRILHVAEGCLSSDVFGTSRLQAVYNRLEDIEKILGASSEGYWKKAFSGTAFIKDPEADWGDTESDMEDEIEEYYHGLTRWMRLSGIDIHEFQSKVDSPKFHFEIQMAVLSAASRIPVRILTGSERGELASSQDESSWLSRVDERRKTFAWPAILKPYIERLIAAGVLPQPKEYWCEWPDVTELSEKDQAEVSATKATAMKDYAAAMEKGFDLVVPPRYFLTDFLGVDEDRALEYEKLGVQIEEEARREAEEAAAAVEGIEDTDDDDVEE